MSTALDNYGPMITRARENECKREYYKRCLELVSDPESMNYLIQNKLGEDMDFGHFLSSFMRRQGDDETRSLVAYVHRKAEEVALPEMRLLYDDIDVDRVLA